MDSVATKVNCEVWKIWTEQTGHALILDGGYLSDYGNGWIGRITLLYCLLAAFYLELSKWIKHHSFFSHNLGEHI